MDEIFHRTKIVIGEDGFNRLKNSWVAIFGIGGVGSFAVEALARCGIGKLTLVDYDDVEMTNVNRQIHALITTIGKPKVEVMRKRIKNINPECVVYAEKIFLCEDNIHEMVSPNYAYIIDAVDDVESKVLLIEQAVKKGVPIISCMGAGNKVDPTKLKVSNLFDTRVCPLAKIVRKKLRKKGICEKIKAVFSTEKPHKTIDTKITGSLCSVTSTTGLLAAGEVIKDLTKRKY